MFVFLMFSALLALQENEPQITEEFKFRFVQLDVAAFDKVGNPVTDLKPTDFVVTEGKKKITLDSFRIVDFEKQSAVSLNMETLQPITRSGEEPSEDLVAQYILVLDFESGNLMEIRRTFSELEQFLASFDPQRKVRVLIYSMEHGRLSEIYQDNIEAVKQTLDTYKNRYLETLEGRSMVGNNLNTGEYDESDRSSRRLATKSKLNRDLDELETKLRQCREVHRPNSTRNIFEMNQCIDGELQAFLDIQNDRVERVLGELESLTGEFQDMKGLKSLLFVSPGFSINPGQSGVTLAEYYRNYARSSMDNFNRDNVDEDVQAMMIGNGSSSSIRSTSYENEFKKVVNACTRNRVIFHTFDLFNYGRGAKRLTGLEHGSEKPSRVQVDAYRQYGLELTEGLARLAEESGGRFSSGVSLLNPLTSVLNERQFLYVLGYESPDGEPGKFRTIKVKCKRKGVELRYRKGYIAD